ncbi:hypothetical protein Q3O59_08395 [Alkalimonas delamerensis]|uniref:Uncharacterized protein n=1 Tax=Alkalimonas delamerensis TaxID=265981 RepID=A0ABT9GQ01_9GAMM|nr:hypothetical protein [Alkalimonas delamerensis]MDP4529048.1 hypothetical protein [Alkalimonas delamerensis]
MKHQINKGMIATALIAASAASYGQVTVQSIDAAAGWYTGMSQQVEFVLVNDDQPRDLIARFGLKFYDPGFPLIEYQAELESAGIEEWLGTVEVGGLQPHEHRQLSSRFQLPLALRPDHYFLVVSVLDRAEYEQEPVAEVIEDELPDVAVSSERTFFADWSLQLIKPDLPNIKLDEARLFGANGYNFSLESSSFIELGDEAYPTLRLNFSVSTEAELVVEPLDVAFQLTIPNYGSFPLRYVFADSEQIQSEFWIEPECSQVEVLVSNESAGMEWEEIEDETQLVTQCYALQPGQVKTYDLNLLVDAAAMQALQQMPETAIAQLEVTVNPEGRIEEWQGQLSDNQASLPLLYIR